MKRIISMIILIVIAVSSIFAIYSTTETSEEKRVYEIVLEETKDRTKALNSVSAVVFDFRGYDTFGEAIVLFTAILGVASILRGKSKEDNNEVD